MNFPCTTQRDTFLAHFIPARRSFITNLFLFAVRRGMQTPRTVLTSVEDELQRAHSWSTADSIERYDEAAAIMAAQHDDALAFAAWALAWEALTPAQKEQHRAAQGEVYRRTWMEHQAPTDKQVSYVRALGYTGEITSRQHASALIDQLRRGHEVPA